MSDDIIVKVKKDDLERIINANTEVYNLLDSVRTLIGDIDDKTREAYRILEDVPSDTNDIIVEDEVEEEKET